MKSKIIILLVVLIPFFVISQEIHYGLSVGFNMAKYLGDADKFANDLSNELNQIEDFSDFSFENKSRTGFGIGFFIDYQINKSLSIQPEIQYIQKGTNFSGDGIISVDDGYNNYTFRVQEDMIMQIDYVDLNVLAKYLFGTENIKPYLIAGPGISYLVSSRMKVKVKIEDESDSESEKYDGFKNLDVNFNLGVGLDFAETLRADIRYQFGFIPVLKDEYDDGFKMQNGGFAINLVAIF
ncbi:MAG: PorT family protein [Bacteroidales bacterium]|nr:PorT family protein [Bacteroidales bacterium]